MRVVFFAHSGFQRDPLFRYMFSHVAERFQDSRVVAVQARSTNMRGRIHSLNWKRQRFGWQYFLGVLTGYPLKVVLLSRDFAIVERRLAELPQPRFDISDSDAVWVETTNGPSTVRVIRDLQPDVLVHAGAGIIRPPVLEVPRAGTLNLHAGIAPPIRGLQSIHWALLEGRPDWAGSTVHFVDSGIDTGTPLAYHKIADVTGRTYSELFVDAIEGGVRNLVAVLERLEAGERWEIPFEGESTYRSSITGWKLLRLRILHRPGPRRRWGRA